MPDLNNHKYKRLEFIEREKDLDKMFDKNLKLSSHIINQANKAN